MCGKTSQPCEVRGTSDSVEELIWGPEHSFDVRQAVASPVSIGAGGSPTNGPLQIHIKQYIIRSIYTLNNIIIRAPVGVRKPISLR